MRAKGPLAFKSWTLVSLSRNLDRVICYQLFYDEHISIWIIFSLHIKTLILGEIRYILPSHENIIFTQSLQPRRLTKSMISMKSMIKV